MDEKINFMYVPEDGQFVFPIHYRLEILLKNGRNVAGIYSSKEACIGEITRICNQYDDPIASARICPIIKTGDQVNTDVRKVIEGLKNETNQIISNINRSSAPVTDQSVIKNINDISHLQALAPNAKIDLGLIAPGSSMSTTNSAQPSTCTAASKPKIKFIKSGGPDWTDHRMVNGKYIPLVDMGNEFSKNIIKSKQSNQPNPEIIKQKSNYKDKACSMTSSNTEVTPNNMGTACVSNIASTSTPVCSAHSAITQKTMSTKFDIGLKQNTTPGAVSTKYLDQLGQVGCMRFNGEKFLNGHAAPNRSLKA